jgi:cytochrome P450
LQPSCYCPNGPRLFRRDTKVCARKTRALITQLTTERMDAINIDTALDDLATKIMTTADAETGETFGTEEMVDQVAIFFLAGHETSASALAWALYLMTRFPEWQEKVADEPHILTSDQFGLIFKLRISRDVFRETLRLYPSVPMMVREASYPKQCRDCEVKGGNQTVISPWHLHRHERLWDNPNGFDPTQWGTENGRKCQRDAYILVSAGSRVCTGASFTMFKGILILSRILRDFRVELLDEEPPVPVANLTVRSCDGIRLRIVRR